MDALGQAAIAKAEIDIKFADLIKGGVITDTIPMTLGGRYDRGHADIPDVSIHLAQEQNDDELIKRLWRETAEFRDRGIDIVIFYHKPGRKDPDTYRG
jgi:hypothetical protein